MRRAASFTLAARLLPTFATFATFAAFAATATTASAQTDKALAKEAYERGTQAHARGDFQRAAEEFAKADALAPSPVALQAALDAAVDADDFVLGAELLERSKRLVAARSAALAASIETATKKLGARAGHVKVACPSGARCTATLDGASFDAARGLWMRAGPHTLVIQVDGTPDTRTVEVRSGESMEVVAARAAAAPPAPIPAPMPSASAPPTPARTPPQRLPPETAAAGPDAKPLPPVVFWVTAGVTVVLGTATTFMALNASTKHKDFVDAGCGTAPTDACSGLKDVGETSQTRANVAFAVTGVAAAATVVIGVFFTDWAGSKKSARVPLLVPVTGGIAASWGATF